MNVLKYHPLLGYNLSLEVSCIIRPRDQSAGNSGSSWLVGVLTFLYALGLSVLLLCMPNIIIESVDPVSRDGPDTL